MPTLFFCPCFVANEARKKYTCKPHIFKVKLQLKHEPIGKNGRSQPVKALIVIQRWLQKGQEIV